MEQSQDQSVRISIISLVIAELLLLFLLWKPMSRLRLTANVLPLLAEHRFVDAKKYFQSLHQRSMFTDETDLLNATAFKLSTELESLQNQLEKRAVQLTLRGEELEKERDFVNQLLDTVHAIIIIQDENGQIQLCNKFAVRLTGYSSIEMRGQTFISLLDEDGETDRISRRISDVVEGELSEYQHEAVLKTRDDERLNLAWRHAVLYNHDDESRQVLSVAVDISARVKAEQELAWLANHDSLSGLLNRRRFEEELYACLAESLRFNRNFAVMFIDLDDFKSVNDNCGHYIGDELIKAVANTLKENVRATDVIARLGGDEFGVILRSFKDDELSCIVERHRKELTKIQLKEDKHGIQCTASIGVATMHEGDKNIDDVIANADLAMYEAKKTGKNNWCLYQPNMKKI
jgi:diguanylate cyclase (GGDEF)-like protein/PAS domain S-box-containing protein